MRLLKLLDPLEKLETQLSELYKRFSEIFRNDAEASVFFYQMSVDEAAHADLVRFERRQVRADPTHFKEVDVDSREVEKISSYADHLLKSAEGLTVEKALEASIDIENSVADQHYITAITLSNSDVSRLFKSLTSFDCRHFLAFEDFARKRGFAFEIRDTEYIKSCRLNEPKQEKRPDNEQTVPQQPVDISQEFVDRINYLYTWNKSMGYYKLLGIRDYATEPEIRQSYRRLAKEFHPDLYLGFPDDLKEKLNTIFSLVNMAYSTLMNPETRRRYDETLSLGGRK
jgi:rubrerythrin